MWGAKSAMPMPGMSDETGAGVMHISTSAALQHQQYIYKQQLYMMQAY